MEHSEVPLYMKVYLLNALFLTVKYIIYRVKICTNQSWILDGYRNH